MFTNNKRGHLVSVILITCNRSSLIARSIDSIMTQDHCNFELLVMDASTNENTQNIVLKYQDTRIKYHRIIDEEYVAKTFLYAISIAEGEYIAFLDDDDEWISPQKLSKQLALFKKLPSDYGIVYCWWEIVFDDTGQKQHFDHKTARGDVFQDMLAKNVINGLPSIMIKKKVFDELGGVEDSPNILPSDHLMLTKFCKYYKVDYVAEVLVRCHERHGFGSMNNISTEKFSEQMRMNLYLRFLHLFSSDYENNPKAKKEVFKKVLSCAVKANQAYVLSFYSRLFIKEYADYKFVLRIYIKYILSFVGIAMGKKKLF